MTSQRTFLARHAAHALAALLLTGFGFPLLSSPALAFVLFFNPESSTDAGDWDSLLESIASNEDLSVLMTMAGIFYEANPGHVISTSSSFSRRQTKNNNRNGPPQMMINNDGKQ